MIGVLQDQCQWFYTLVNNIWVVLTGNTFVVEEQYVLFVEYIFDLMIIEDRFQKPSSCKEACWKYFIH